ncbi:unnamed protein product [Ostreobium quekettii]|uniref:BTB domain-containing protein n=1 Tax=Ostreobium quekettii TaxID=121088 RepID=A0A8S1J861_9CHLO|nr:unnamed protein product [Ostreobium quekettii]
MLAAGHLVPSYLPEDDGDLGALCDTVLAVQKLKLPVHGQVLAVHSGHFRKLVADMKGNKASHENGRMVIPLDDSVSVDDAVLMLSFVYGKRIKVDTADEASRLVSLGDRYDIPALLRLSVSSMNARPNALYFVRPQTGSHAEPCLDAGHWLAITDRLRAHPQWRDLAGLEELRTQCLWTITKDLLLNCDAMPGKESKALLSVLDEHGVSASSVGEAAIALASFGMANWRRERREPYQTFVERHLPDAKRQCCEVLRRFHRG